MPLINSCADNSIVVVSKYPPSHETRCHCLCKRRKHIIIRGYSTKIFPYVTSALFLQRIIIGTRGVDGSRVPNHFTRKPYPSLPCRMVNRFDFFSLLSARLAGEQADGFVTNELDIGVIRDKSFPSLKEGAINTGKDYDSCRAYQECFYRHRITQPVKDQQIKKLITQLYRTKDPDGKEWLFYNVDIRVMTGREIERTFSYTEGVIEGMPIFNYEIEPSTNKIMRWNHTGVGSTKKVYNPIHKSRRLMNYPNTSEISVSCHCCHLRYIGDIQFL